MNRPRLLLLVVLLGALPGVRAAEFIEIDKSTKSFILAQSRKPFLPWGFNYDRDFKMRLLEEYWDKEWPTVEEDLREMKQLGGTVIRIHLQFHQFMEAPDKPNAANLARLEKLLRLAEELGLYLDLTGLGCYRIAQEPPWYAAMNEKDRWVAQQAFWEAIARTCADRPGVFCYDLANEPLVPTGKEKQWVHPAQLAGFNYLQFAVKDLAGRDRAETARQWCAAMVQAIRKHDKQHLITVGIALFNFGKPEEVTGFVPAKLADDLDFISVHIYPDKGKIDAAVETIRRCQTAKPLIIEEIFPMNCDLKEMSTFFEKTRPMVQGYISFYWGQTPAELRKSGKLLDPMIADWLEAFSKMK